MTHRLAPIAIMAFVGLLVFSGCSSEPSDPPAKDVSTVLAGLTGQIGSKDYTEQYILAYLTTDLLNANGADVTANTKLVGSNTVRRALERGDIIGYWDYTGTSWVSYNGQTAPIPDPVEQFAAVKEIDATHGIRWMDPAPFNNSYAFAIRSDTAQRLGVKSLSDVARLPRAEQTFCIETEFSTRDDGWYGLNAAYEFNAPDGNLKMLDTGMIYAATADGTDCNFGEISTTDGRIAALGLTVLADDKQFFPLYQGGLGVYSAIFDAYPAIAPVIAQLAPLLTDQVMQSLNARVDVEGEEPEDVAKAFLKEQGLIN